MKMNIATTFEDQESIEKEVETALNYEDSILDRVSRIQRFVDGKNEERKTWLHKAKLGTSLKSSFLATKLNVGPCAELKRVDNATKTTVAATKAEFISLGSLKQAMQDIVTTPNNEQERNWLGKHTNMTRERKPIRNPALDAMSKDPSLSTDSSTTKVMEHTQDESLVEPAKKQDVTVNLESKGKPGKSETNTIASNEPVKHPEHQVIKAHNSTQDINKKRIITNFKKRTIRYRQNEMKKTSDRNDKNDEHSTVRSINIPPKTYQQNKNPVKQKIRNALWWEGTNKRLLKRLKKCHRSGTFLLRRYPATFARPGGCYKYIGFPV